MHSIGYVTRKSLKSYAHVVKSKKYRAENLAYRRAVLRILRSALEKARSLGSDQ